MMMVMFRHTGNYKHQTDLSEDLTELNRSLVNKFMSCYETWFTLHISLNPPWPLDPTEGHRTQVNCNQPHLFTAFLFSDATTVQCEPSPP